jgi:hypothetical protein
MIIREFTRKYFYCISFWIVDIYENDIVDNKMTIILQIPQNKIVFFMILFIKMLK